jgi:hypothetical protein
MCRVQYFIYSYKRGGEMTEQTTERKAMLGECSFCKSQIEKRKMTQHLKSCKQRLEAIAAEKQDDTKAGKAGKKKKAEPVTFFHILVEGRYNPQYWMHIEMPASDELADLDAFLRGIWVECCDHLSSFTIGGVEYRDERGDFMDFGFFPGDGNAVEVEEEQEEAEEDGEIDMEEVLKQLPEEYSGSLSPDLRTELMKFRDPYEAVKFLRVALKAVPEDPIPRTREELEEARKNPDVYQEKFLKNFFLKNALRLLITMLEDRSMYQPLERLLEVGQKFAYEYDFGSTTYLNLKVMGKREGMIQGKKDRVRVLARNLRPKSSVLSAGNPRHRWFQNPILRRTPIVANARRNPRTMNICCQ